MSARPAFNPAARAFTLTDLAAALATIGIAAALLLPASADLRKKRQLASAQGKLHWIASITSSYAADFDDRLWALSWQAQTRYEVKGRLYQAGSGRNATAAQAVDIIYRRSGRDVDIGVSWLPLPMFSHLPLADYLDREAILFEFISPADAHRLRWARDPGAFDRGEFLPLQPEPTLTARRWPHSSSYELPPALASTPISGTDAVLQHSSFHRSYTTQMETRFEGAAISAVRFPAQKVHLYDAVDRFSAVPWYYAPTSTEPRRDPSTLTLMCDGSAGRRRTSEANPGWLPQAPAHEGMTRFRYSPSPWEPGGELGGQYLSTAHYRFTRGGPAGRDFGGPEIDTGQP